MKIGFLTLIFCFVTQLNAQSQLISSFNFNEIDITDEIIFDQFHKNEKKVVKFWQNSPNINKIVILNTYDSNYLHNLLVNISKNKNIEELHISLNQNTVKLFSQIHFKNIRLLKIINSSSFNQIELINAKRTLNQLNSFSWINNKEIISIDVLNELKQLKNIELIDTHRLAINNSLNSQLSKLIHLETICFSVLPNQDFSLNSLIKWKEINVIKINNELKNDSSFNYFQIEENESHAYTMNANLKLNYYNLKPTCNSEEFSELSYWLNIGINQFYKPKTVNKPQDSIINNQLLNNYFYSKNSAFFEKPIPEIKTNEKRFRIRSKKDTILQLESGTNLIIPANAFVDTNGIIMDSSINIVYREMTDPLRIFSSGIPMKVNEKGKESTLTSAGMFEFRAYNDSNELKINPSKKVQIDFASIDDGKDYNFYEFDKTSMLWQNKNMKLNTNPIGKDTVIKNKKSIENTIYNYVTQPVIYNFDTTRFNDRYESFEYYNLRNKYNPDNRIKYSAYFNQPSNNKRVWYSSSDESKMIRKNKNLFKFHFVYREKNDTNKSLVFNLYKLKQLNYFPELSVFDGIKLYHDEFDKRVDFKNKYIKNKIYSDVRVEYDKGSDYCTLILKEKEEFVQIQFKLYDDDVLNKRRQNNYKRSFYKTMLKYSKKLEKREKAFNYQIQLDMRRQQNNIKKREKINLQNDSFVNQMVSWMKPVNSRRRIELVSTGLYNCDVQYETVQAKVYHVDFLSDSMNSIDVANIYVFDENANTYFKYESNNIVFQPETLIGLIVISKNGQKYYLNKKDIKTIDFTENPLVMHVHMSEKKLETLDHLMAMFIKN